MSDRLDLGQQLACGDPSCDFCTLGPEHGEDRADWLARLKARFRANPPLGHHLYPSPFFAFDRQEGHDS